MGRMYTAAFSGISVSAAQDFFELTAPATGVILLHEVHITQDAGETSEQLPVTIKRVPATVTSGSGGASVTPAKKAPGDASSGATVERNNTTRATSTGTIETIHRLGDNVLNGWHWVFAPEARVVVPPSGVLVVGLETAPGAALTMSGEITWEEVG